MISRLCSTGSALRIIALSALLLAACADPRADAPPAVEATFSEAAPAASSAPARASRVHVNRRTRHYPVHGTNAETLYTEMYERGPREDAPGSDAYVYFGRTTWQARWTLTYAERPGTCRLRRADVWLDIEQTLPRWQPGGPVPETLTEQWDTFNYALRRHEDGHEALAEQAGHEILERLSGLEAPTCAALKEWARTRAHAALERGIEANEQFDARTRHGTTEGVRWPPR